MIYLGVAGFCIGLFGLFLFRGYHHDHNIGDEIVEQKKNDFVLSVFDTLHNIHTNHTNQEASLIEHKNVLTKSASTNNETASSMHEQRRKQHESILPSLNDAYTNAFFVVDKLQQESLASNTQEVHASDQVFIGSNHIGNKTRESRISSTLVPLEDKSTFENDFQESGVYATLHALCLHSFVS